jgi:hypothetical protein
MTTISIQVAPRVGPANPRGSRLGAWLFLAIGHGLQALFSRPAPVEPVRSPEQDAQAVREMAQQYLQVDPRFAAELFAAADRHERLHGIG